MNKYAELLRLLNDANVLKGRIESGEEAKRCLKDVDKELRILIKEYLDDEL